MDLTQVTSGATHLLVAYGEEDIRVGTGAATSAGLQQVVDVDTAGTDDPSDDMLSISAGDQILLAAVDSASDADSPRTSSSSATRCRSASSRDSSIAVGMIHVLTRMFHRPRRVATDATSLRPNPSKSLAGRLASRVLHDRAPMSDISVTRHEKGAWTDEVFEAMARLLGPGSGPGRAVLEHELLRCDLLYLATDLDGPCAFLLGARVRLPVGPERWPARYLGLSVARSDQGHEALLERFTAEARDEEESRGVRVVLFTAAATPLAVRTAETHWSDLQPASDASFREDVLPVVDAARAWLGATVSLDRPFALPRLACGGGDWRRTLDEGGGGDLFRRMGIEQAQGDRLLLLCSVPGRERVLTAQAA